jgi:hypothetical protein
MIAKKKSYTQSSIQPFSHGAGNELLFFSDRPMSVAAARRDRLSFLA